MNKFLSVNIIFLILLLMPLQASAQEITGVDAVGTCTDFEVTVTAANLTDGCWDVKLDIPGRIDMSDGAGEGDWKSTFYYKDQAMCHPDTDSAVLSLKLDSKEGLVRGTAKIMLNSKVREKDFAITQSCPPEPQPLSGEWALFVAFVVILVFGWALTWWWKQGHKNDEKNVTK